MVPFFEFLCFATPSPIELHGLRDKKFLFGSAQSDNSSFSTSSKSITAYGIFRFSLRLENQDGDIEAEIQNIDRSVKQGYLQKLAHFCQIWPQITYTAELVFF
jgi:hypothetical protein